MPTADTTPPSVSVQIASVATDDIINISESQQSTIAVTGVVTGEFNSSDKVTVTIDKTPYSGSIDGSGHFTVDVPTNEFTGHTQVEASITTQDTAGNTGSDKDSHSYIIATDIPLITLDPIASGNDRRPAISGHVEVSSHKAIPQDTEVDIQITGDANTYRVHTMNGQGDFELPKGALLQDLPEGSSDITATVTDKAGNVGMTAEPVVVDITAGKITIDDHLAKDDVINHAEQGQDLIISGTTSGIEDGQLVTVNFNGQNYPGSVSGGIWSATVDKAHLVGITDGSTLVITADVNDVAGNKAIQAHHDLGVDLSASATIQVDPLYPINHNTTGNVMFTGSVSGDAQAGDVITVEVNGQEFTGQVLAKAGHLGFGVDVPTSVLKAHQGTYSVSVTLKGEDSHGNTYIGTSQQDVTVDSVEGTIAINDHLANDDVINHAEQGQDLVISGTTSGIEDGQVVTVHFNHQDYTTTVQGNQWSATVDHGDLANLNDSANLVITANVNDKAGNPAVEASHNLGVDTHVGVPTIQFPTPTSTSGEYNAAEVAADGTIEATIVLPADAVAGDILTIGHVDQILSTADISAQQVKTQVTPGATVTATLTDQSENMSSPATETAPTADTTPPSVSVQIESVATDDIINISESQQSTIAVTGVVTGEFNSSDKVTVTIDKTPYSGSIDGSGHFTVDVPTNEFTGHTQVEASISTQDAAGNTGSATDSHTYTIATVIPLITLNPITAGNDKRPAISGHVDVNSHTVVPQGTEVEIHITGDANTYRVQTMNGQGDFELPKGALLQDLPDGSSYISATVTDKAGNVGKSTETVIVDTTPPSVSVQIENIAKDDIINLTESQQSTIAVTGSVTGEFNPSDKVIVTIDKTPYSGSIDSSGHFTVDVPSSEFTGHTQVEASITTQDAEGNTGSDTDSHSYIIATDIPLITLDPIASGNDRRPAISGHVEVSSHKAIPQDTEVDIQIRGEAKIYKVYTTNENGDFELPKGALVKDLPEGASDIIVTVTDKAGNVGMTAEPVVVDITAGKITIDDHLATDDVINQTEQGQDLIISGTTSGIEDGQLVTVNFNGQNYPGSVTGGKWSTTVDKAHLSGLTSGSSLTITANVNDKAGNPALEASHNLVVDTTVHTPVISLDSTSDTYGQDPTSSAIHIGSDSDLITKDVTPTFSITGVDVDAESVEIFDGKTSLGFAHRDGKGLEHWSFTPPKDAGLTKGIHHITAEVTDKVGNHASSIACDVTIDTENPKPTLSVHNANNNNASPILTGTAEAGSIVVIKDGNVELGSVLADKDGNYEYDMSSPEHAHVLGEGAHELVAEAIDKAGNLNDSDKVSTTIKPESKLVYAAPGENINVHDGARLIYGTLNTHQASAPVDHDIHLTIDKHEVTIKQDGTIVAPGLTIDDAHQFLLDHPYSGNVNGGDNHIVSFSGVDDLLAHTSNSNLQNGVQSVNGDGYYLYLPGKSSDYTLKSEITGSGGKYNISGGLHGHGIDISSMNGVRGIIFSDGETLLASSEQTLSQGSLAKSVTTETFHMNTDTFLHTTSPVPDSHRVVLLTGNGEDSTEFKIIAGDGTVIATNKNLDKGDPIVIHENQLKGLHIEIPKDGKIDLHFEGHIEHSGQQIGDTLRWHFVVDENKHVGKIDDVEYVKSPDEPAQDTPEIDLNALADSSSDHHSTGASAYLDQLGIDAQHHAQANDQPSDIDVVLGHDPATSVDDHGVPVVDHSIQPDHTQHQDDDDPTKHHHQTDTGTVDWGSSHH